MYRKWRLARIRRIRLIRDELMKEVNLGRCRKLAMKFDIVESVKTHERIMGTTVTVTLDDGFEITTYGDSPFIEAANLIYQEYLKLITPC